MFFIKIYNEQELVNVAWGIDITIKELSEIIIKKVEFKGQLGFEKLSRMLLHVS